MSQTGYWRLAITPLSPVHLGTGQDYEPTNYVIDDGTLYAFDGVAALEALPATERERLGRMVGGRPTPDMLRQVQRFFYDNRDILIAVSGHQVRVTRTVEAFYGERVGRIVQHEHGGGQVQNKLEIERTAYNPPTGQAILPGSGLKGAMRTALLNAVNNGHRLPQDLERDRRANQKLQERLFQYHMGHLENDPMRLVRIADASLTEPDSFATQLQFAVNRKKDPVRRGDQEIASQAEQQGLYQLLECLPPMQPRAFEGGLSIQGTDGVESPKLPSLRFRLGELAIACNTFYRPILDAELDLLLRRGFLEAQWAGALTHLMDGSVGQALREGRAWLLRVGRHSGAESVTLNGVRRIKIMKGRGEAPDFLDHAKTLWLASDERLAQRNLLPFGWLLVEPWQERGDLTPWPETGYDAGASAWRLGVRKRQIGLAGQLRQARQREEARSKAEEEAAAVEAARLARRESMSPEELAVDKIRGLLERDRAAGRKEAGGELANALVSALKEAEKGWSGPACIQLADLALEVYGFIGWPGSKKKKERKALIETVRGRAS